MRAAVARIGVATGDVEVHVLPPLLHNRPQAIAGEVRGLVRRLQAAGRTVVVAYADCGTYGALDEVCADLGVHRLRGLHCYDVFAGSERIEALFQEEPGTYLLTDFLVRSFHRTVMSELGLDRHPELWADYFGNYRRVVWLAQDPTASLEHKARSIAARFGHPLEIVHTGGAGLDDENPASPRAGDRLSAMLRRGLRAATAALTAARYEVIPTSGIGDAVLEFVPHDVTVAVTASPTKGIEATFELSARLAAAGYDVVPHLSARLVRDREHLSELVAWIQELALGDVFVPAGDADPPAGIYDSSLSLLEALQDLGPEAGTLPRLGITGYPESHPKIDDDVRIQAMGTSGGTRRTSSATCVSMLAPCRPGCTACRRGASPCRSASGSVRSRGPYEARVDVASKIGVADSVRYLRSHASTVLRLNAPGGYKPDRLLNQIGPMLADPASKVEGLHVLPSTRCARPSNGANACSRSWADQPPDLEPVDRSAEAPRQRAGSSVPALQCLHERGQTRFTSPMMA